MSEDEDREAVERVIDQHRRHFEHLAQIRDKHVRPPPGFAERHPLERKHDRDE